MEIIKLMDIHDIFVCGEKYIDNIPMPLSFKEISELPLILLEPKSNSRQYVEKYFYQKELK